MPRKSAKRSKAGLEPVVTVFMGVQWLLHRILRLIYEKNQTMWACGTLLFTAVIHAPRKVFLKDKR